jgi:hypothetical protein
MVRRESSNHLRRRVLLLFPGGFAHDHGGRVLRACELRKMDGQPEERILETILRNDELWFENIMDAYVSRYTLIIAGMFECLFIGHVYDAERLQNEARALCGSGVGRALFAPIIKWVAPAILGAMLGYNVAQEAKGTYGGYPRWATAVFGWVLCVLGPLSFVVYGFFRPPRLKRPIEEAGIYAGN